LLRQWELSCSCREIHLHAIVEIVGTIPLVSSHNSFACKSGDASSDDAHGGLSRLCATYICSCYKRERGSDDLIRSVGNYSLPIATPMPRKFLWLLSLAATRSSSCGK
jgi:hypothetical protein